MFSKQYIPEATVTIALETIYNNLMSLALLTTDASGGGVEPWVTETAIRLTAEQRHHNRLVFEGFGEALLLDTEYADFPAYLVALAAQSPLVLRERVLARRIPLGEIDNNTAQAEAFRQEVEQWLTDPVAMHQLIVTHLSTLWDTMLADEWRRHLLNLSSLVHILNQKQWTPAPAGVTIRTFIQRELPDAISVQLAGVQHVIFVPSPHVRLHATRFGSDTTLWVFVLGNFWALPTRTEPIQRSEVLGPLHALADETRLQILELLAAQGELRSQEMIAQLDVSQPTVSRHLKELRAARFITEQRGIDANKSYQFNPEAISGLFRTLIRLLSTENARAITTDLRNGPLASLRRFLDRQGRLTIWPAKQKDQKAVLDYLITKFTPEQALTEIQVNELLNQWHTYSDPAYLRRTLIEAKLLSRTDNGSQYWRISV